MEDSIINMESMDPYTQVLIEGIDIIEKKPQWNLVDMLINTPANITKKESLSHENMEESQSSGEKETESVNPNSRGQKEEKQANEITQEESSKVDGQTTWEEMTIANEIDDIIKAAPSEIKKVKSIKKSRYNYCLDRRGSFVSV